MKKCISSKIILFTLVLCMALASFPISLGQTTDLTAEKTDQTQAESTQSTTQKETEKKVEEPSTQNAAVETTAQIQPQAAPVIPEYKGTADKPHPITNKYELASIGNPEFGREYPLDGNYIQTQDIVFDEADFKDGGDFYNDGKGWKPIGNIDRKGFVGKYNGDEYVINNIYVNRSGEGFCGIFGAGGKEAKLEINAEIFNIRTYNGFIKGDNSASGIFGGTVSVIENCINSNKVEGGFYTAGLAMKIAKGGRANKCINFGEMNGERANGGLFYLLSKNAVINNSCNKGSITGKGYKSGGIVACNEGRIINCYNSGNISSISWAGGIASESKDGEISNSFNHGNISLISIFCQHNYYAGGIVGNPYQTYINNCFNFGEIFSDVTLTSKSDTVYLGGISGSSSYTTIRNSYNRKKYLLKIIQLL